MTMDTDDGTVILLVLPTIHRLQPARPSESLQETRKAAKVCPIYPLEAS
jgi:hypothetical protein